MSSSHLPSGASEVATGGTAAARGALHRTRTTYQAELSPAERYATGALFSLALARLCAAAGAPPRRTPSMPPDGACSNEAGASG